MKFFINHINVILTSVLIGIFSLFYPSIIISQTNTNCTDNTSSQTYSSTAFFNYGSASDLYNSERNATVTVGQISTQLNMYSLNYKSELGFWGQFLLPPLAPYVQASEGNLGDRVEITWEVSALSPVVTDVFKVYRNGTFLDEVENDERVYVDYNVVAGEFYTYSVRGVNKAGIGKAGSSVGFLNPNGTITGQVKTSSGNPVADCVIDLNPTLGSSLRFNGDGSCFADYSEVYDTNTFSATLWVRQDSLNDIAGLLDLGSSAHKNWYIHTLDSLSGRGINAGLGGGSGSIDYIFPEETATDWHHVAVTYNSKTLLLYVDGELRGSLTDTITTDSILVYIGATSESTGYFKGLLDEVIIYNKQLSQTEIRRQMNKSVSARVDGLVSYWKMDEGTGTTTYDLTDNDNRLYMCGPTWENENSPITNSTLTDQNGFYILEGINYGSGETFTVQPSKKIYESISLEFNAANEDMASLTNFELTDTTTISTTFNVFDLDGNQTILAKGDDFNLRVQNGSLVLNIDGQDFNFGVITLGWHQVIIELSQNGGSIDIEFYLDGVLKSSEVATGTIADWYIDPQVWTLGGSPTLPNSFFNGLVEEVVFYEGTLSLSEIQTSNNIGTDESNSKIYSYFPLNESIGDSLYNISIVGGTGFATDASWANDSKHLAFTEHEFLPSSKFVSLNKTNTSTDQVDFIDLSTIPVSGFVRYDKTDCFADSVEILVNGLSASPPIFTDEDGKFIAEFEPGSTATLTPKYNGHSFSPAFYEVRNANSPVAGVLFLDKTTRTVSGQLAGGKCRQSIIPNGGSAKVVLSTLDGCYEKEIEITDANGNYTFENVPPFKCAVGVSSHSLQYIKDYFDVAGGTSIDLTFENDTVDFIYYSEPVVTISSFGDEVCGTPVLEQNKSYTTTVQLHQEYPGGNCAIDTALIIVYDGFNQDNILVDTLVYAQSLDYSFIAGPPNIASPYTKTIQVDAVADGQTASIIEEAVIVGIRPRNVNFTSTAPSIPLMILHDPPGDGSYSYIEEGEKNCTTLTFEDTNASETAGGIKYSYGPDAAFFTGLGVAVETEIDVIADFSILASSKSTFTQSNATELCIETLTNYSTDQDELLVGDTSDVYIGGALNLLFGITDILKIDTVNGNCFALDTGLNVFPDRFETNFVYSEYDIRKNIIPGLLAVGDTTSVNQWEDIINKNTQNKEAANFVENISFGSGVNIEKSTTTSKSSNNQYNLSTEVNNTLAGELGLLVNGVGLTGMLSTTITVGNSTTINLDSTEQTKIGYRLSDNDPGDIFTVNVKTDPVYGTPIFETISGVSSCPYEENTVNRDEVSMTVDKFVANNIRENDAAVFTFNLGNVSQSEESREYIFSLRTSSNVNGAEVKIAGTDPIDTEFFIAPFESVPVTVSVERGPTAYSDTLTFDLFVQCEDDRRVALSEPKTNNQFNQSITVAVNFIEPCSSVDINNPQQDWVQTPADGPLRPIRLFNYDILDPDLDFMRVQYRRSQGNGVWVNIMDIPKDSLGVTFENLDWDTDGLADGLYEIRALAMCTGGLDVGISHVIKGKIERTPPELFGTAEPADGVLSKGDEISITFNEPIDCNNILLAAGIGNNIDNNNLGLYNTETGALVDFTMSCSEDKIILVPNVATKFLENKVLRVELDSILDLAGNKSGHLEWEFVVDQNSLNWLDREDVVVVKQEEEFVHVERRIENRGGFNIDWELQNIPEYCSVYPIAGTLAPGDVRIINFDFDETMDFGKQLDTLILSGAEGDEPMIIDARVVCPPPNWEINANEWEFAMNFVCELNIEGTVSEDEEDILAAFIDGELRGVTNVEYFEAIDKHLAFLTVYSNDVQPLSVDMRIWDASTCLLFSPVVESFVFESDDLIGTPLAPQIIHTNSLVLKEIEVNPGWNWLSFNLELQEPSPDSVLQDINDPVNGVIKSQTEFAQYADGFGWFGSLDTIGNISAYQLRVNAYDTIEMIGTLIDPDSIEIPLNVGWNWIGYIPRSPMSTNQALASVTSLDGDVIKSQTQFSQYVSGFGWIGTLKTLRPDEGYIINTSIQDTLMYPDVEFGLKGNTIAVEKRNSTLPEDWEVNPSEYEHSMTMTSIAVEGEENIIQEGWMLSAFVDGQCRGIAEAIWVAPIDAYMFFLTSYSNASGELMEYRIYDGVQEYFANEQEYFGVDTQLGDIENPYQLSFSLTSIEEELSEDYLRIAPNPVVKGEFITLDYLIRAKSGRLEVFDIHGSLVNSFGMQGQSIRQKMSIPTNDFMPGMYTIRLVTENGIVSKKLLILQ